jgi:predicted outer membrane repeat protein
VVRNSINVEIAKSDIFSNNSVHGGGIAIVDSRRVTVSQCRIRDNRSTDPPGIGKGQGGGIYVGGESSDIVIEANFIYRNQATNFGGGVCIDFPAQRVRLRRNRIGGGAAADGNRVTLDRQTYADAVVLGNPRGGGGGVGIYNTEVVLFKNEIWNNEAHVGGGVEFYVRAYGRLEQNDIANNRTRPEVDYGGERVGGDGGGIAVNNTSVTEENASLHRTVDLINNRIRNNRAEDDGGGIYGTAKALISISGNDTEISGNQARNNGGGIRVSFGSQIRIRNGVIRNNRANMGGGSGGGGGIAARNSKLVLTGCVIDQNEVDNFGGGGVYVVTLEEGGPPVGPSFDDLLTDSYGFSRAELQIDGVTITDNTASGTRGAGAGLYAVYDQYDLHVRIDTTVLDGNHPNHSDSDKRKNVVFQDNSTLPLGGIDNDDDFPSLHPLSGYENTYSP